MASRIQNPSVAPEGDRLDAAIAAADLRISQADRAYELWRNQGIASALNLVERFKQAPGMQSIELPAALATALTRARAQLGDAQLAQMLGGGASLPDQVLGALGDQTTAGVGTLRSDQKLPTAKPKRTKEQRRGIAALYDEAIKELNQ